VAILPPMLRRILFAAALMVGLAPAISFAAPPPPVPALPDTERRTSYSVSGTTCACAVNFAIYGDSTDVDNWIQVWVNGVRKLSTDPTFGWALTSPTGPLSTIPRPITDGVLTFTNSLTATVQIVGARRPRRTTQFQENRGVAARDLNQAFTDVIAQMRESWDKTNDVTGRAILGLPGEAIAQLPSAASRASSFICWDATGLIPLACAPGIGSGNVVGPNTSTNGHIALWSGTTGRILVDGGSPGTGTVTGPVSSTNGGFAKWNGTSGLVLQDSPATIPLTSGGTNNSLTASNGGVAYSDAAGLQILSGTATARQMLQSGASAAPAWSTATWPATTTLNQLLYSSSANVVAGLATATNGTLITDGTTGIPSISSTLPTAVQGNITSLGTITAGVWNGSAITGTNIAANTVANSNLATAGNNTVKSNISGGTSNDSDNTLTAIMDSVFGSTQGSIIYRGASAWSALGPGTNGQFLITQGAANNPVWGAGGAGTGTVTSVTCNGLAITAAGVCPEPFAFENCSLAASVGSSILTVALKDNTGADPSATSPCRIAFRSATASTGSWSIDSVTAALSITTNATGATLGSANNSAFRLWVVAFDNAGTVVLSLFNAVNPTTSQCTTINERVVQTSVAISGSATSAGVYYTPNGTTLTSKAIKILGYVEYNSTGLVTAGTYASGPNFVESFGPGIHKPCEPVQFTQALNATADTPTTSTSFVVNTNQEISITPTSAANLIMVEMQGAIQSTAANECDAAISRGTTANTNIIGAVALIFNNGASTTAAGYLKVIDFPNTASSQTYAGQRRSSAVANCAWPANSTGGSTNKGIMFLTEIMG
jgi:hypothetical protein